MPTQQSFFKQLDTRLSESQEQRLITATYLYNHYGEPSTLLTDKKANWFEPWKRANVSAFKGWNDFSDDTTSLIMKPYVWSALVAYEAQKFFLCMPAAVAQIAKLSPTGFVNKLADMFEAVVASVVLAFAASSELYMQIASLVMRTAITGAKAVGVDLPQIADVIDDVSPSFGV